jgi:hypothetical protein
MIEHASDDGDLTRADHDFDLAPGWLQAGAGAAEALRRMWERLPPPGKALTWMAVWGVARYFGAPSPTAALDLLRALTRLG